MKTKPEKLIKDKIKRLKHAKVETLDITLKENLYSAITALEWVLK